ncbi:mandelate racemase/muconate lactonizing enzyme family protein [Oceanibacterium hippocampi]|uniref:Muconate cycloisomerase 1 n=1 Tax=Oceanibacterium hippocampi TaxID=745714 RepID=A0A1Y5U0K7_9PROT|nr:mandelate racemase/muconate lactonizing enzyme family protein [Oceanibacterium hippocampi]SLN77810.1 Muconate cycloisomerase 1 [Oceanibacterium hippocampi]
MSTATVEKIEAIQLDIPFSQYGPPAGFGGTNWTTANYLIVAVTASDGIVGYGEAFGYNAIPATRAALEKTVAPLLLGKPCENIGACMAALEKPLHIFGRSGPVQYALSGLDIALWDMAGKRAGISVARMLGHGGRGGVRAYASLLKAGEAKPLQKVCVALAEEGHTAIKLHETEPGLAIAAREALGPAADLMLDVNCAWDVPGAREAAGRLVPARLKWLEEPVWPPENVAGLLQVSGIGPEIAAGENCANAVAFDELASSAALAYLQPSVTKVGGISAFLRIGHLAAVRGKRLAPHSPYFGPGLLATLQMAAVFADIEMVEYFGVRLEAPIFGGIELPDDRGILAIPDGPGLGADPDPDVMRRYRAN